MEKLPHNEAVLNTVLKCRAVLKNYENGCVLVGISGGSDSDCVLDILERSKGVVEPFYFFINTGLEMDATHRHLDSLEQKYGIVIHRLRPREPVALSCIKYGLPFMNKTASTYIHRLQLHGFDFADGYFRSFDELMNMYPGCQSALEWWTNRKGETNGGKSMFNISNNAHLKEFLRDYPPDFPISAACCDKAKKRELHRLITMAVKRYGKANVLSVSGIRIAEGGARRGAFSGKSCWTRGGSACDTYRPLQWWQDSDKEEYCSFFNIIHSDAYSCVQLKRTGCCGCPFGSDFESELSALRAFGDGRLAGAAEKIFKASYAYTRQYRDYVKSYKEWQE